MILKPLLSRRTSGKRSGWQEWLNIGGGYEARSSGRPLFLESHCEGLVLRRLSGKE